jgi:hypothetical protein
MFTLEDGSQVNKFPAYYTGCLLYNNNKLWYQHGKFHRIDGPAVEWNNGDKFWYQHGKLHHINGPAVEWANGNKFWYRYGKYHRLEGPAWEEANGSKRWWINDKQITKQTRIVCLH